MKRIGIGEIGAIRIGQVENRAAGTGATVIVAPEGMAAGIDVRGGGPASRDTRTLDPLAAAESIHAVLLAGGSAFGLDAAGGVMKYLAERHIGLPVASACVPLVCQSNIFDLLIGDDSVKPDATMGYDACLASEQGPSGNYRDGNYGAGCGATVGKMLGPDYSMKAGIGSYALQIGSLKVGALVVVNALGNLYDPLSGSMIAGVLSEDRREFRDPSALVQNMVEAQQRDSTASSTQVVSNTTIGAVITNAAFSKAQLCKLASMAHDGFARAINPVHTSMDGDSIYGLSVGAEEASLDLVGILAANVMAQAIVVAATSAESAYGLPCAREIARLRDGR